MNDTRWKAAAAITIALLAFVGWVAAGALADSGGPNLGDTVVVGRPQPGGPRPTAAPTSDGGASTVAPPSSVVVTPDEGDGPAVTGPPVTGPPVTDADTGADPVPDPTTCTAGDSGEASDEADDSGSFGDACA